MAVLSISTTEDGLLSALAPIGLGAATTTALVVDCDPSGPAYPGKLSLAEMVDRGPTRADLSPPRSGVSVLRNGGIELLDAIEVLQAMADGWPSLVLRLPTPAPEIAWPVVRCAPLLPGAFFGVPDPPAVYQSCGWRVKPPDGGLVLPKPSRTTVGSLLDGTVPLRSRWVAAWRSVWRTWAQV